MNNNRISILFFLLFFSANLAGQYSIEPTPFLSFPSIENSNLACNIVVDAGDNILVCEEDFPIQLNGSFTGNEESFSWIASPDLDDETILTPMVSGPGTYTLTVQAIDDVNIVTNGDFESGDTGFTSDYTTGVANFGNYLITDNPQNYFGLLSDCGDHTSGTGNMMIVDGSPDPLAEIWCQVITLTPNTDYNFSMWATMVGSNSAAELYFTIDGVSINPSMTIPLTNCEWTEISTVWNSGTNTSVEVCIRNDNISTFGNDFAIDDIVINSFCEMTDDVVVAVLEANAIASDVTIPCEGDCVMLDGTMSTAGTGVTFEWTSPTGGTIQNGNTLMPTVCETGTYKLVITNFESNFLVTCKDSIEITVDLGLPDPITPIFDGLTTVCYGNTVTYSITSTDPNATDFQWQVTNGTISSGQGTAMIDVLWGNGTMGEVCVFSENTCSQSTTVCEMITIDSIPEIPVILGSPNICNNTIADYEFVPTPDITTITWTTPTGTTIQSGQGSDMITVDWGTVQGGDICLEIENSCGTNSECLTVVYGNVQTNIISQNPLCTGDDNGYVKIIPTSGTAPFMFNWGGGEMTDSIGMLASGTYLVTISDSGGCSSEESITLIDPNPLGLMLQPTPITCHNACDGEILVISSGGTSPHTYAWAGSTNTTDNLTNLCEDTYTVTVTDGNGCTIEDQISLQNPNLITATISQDQTICNGVSADLLVNFIGAGPFDLTLSNGNSFSNVNDGDLISIFPITNTTITITSITQSGSPNCSGTSSASVDIIVNDLPEVPMISGDLNLCDGSLANYCMTNISNVDSFYWEIPPDATFTGQDSDCIDIDWTGSIGGQVCVEAINDCGSTQSCVNVTVNPIPTSTFTFDPVICVDESATINYDGTANAGATFTWDFGSGTILSGSGSGPYEIEWAIGGNQTVSLIVEENGCTSTQISENILVDEPIPSPNINCTSTTSTVTFTWDDVAGATSYTVNDLSGNGGMVIGNSYAVSGLTNGEVVMIEVTAIGNSACGNTVAQASCAADNCPTILVEVEHVDPLCLSLNSMPFDLNVTLTGDNGGGTFNWSGNGMADPTSNTFDPVLAGVGIHDITVTYTENNCDYTDVISIGIFATPTADFVAEGLICVSDNSTVTYQGNATSSATYTWDFDGGNIISGNGQGPFEINWTTTGNYNITLTVEENGCTSTVFSQPIQVDPETPSPVITCSSTTQSVIFSWENIPGVTSFIVTDISGPAGVLNGNSYEVTGLNTGQEVTIELTAVGNSICGNPTIQASCSANNCPMISVEIDPVSSICLTNNSAAFDLNAIITGGNNTGIISWSGNGITDISAGTFDPQIAGVGSHNITSTYTQDNCDFTDVVTIEIFETPSAEFNLDNIICVTENANISYLGNATSAATYTWDFDGGNIISGNGAGPYEINWTAAGNYNITLTVEENGCTSAIFNQAIQVDPVLAEPNITCSKTPTSIVFSWENIPGVTSFQVAELSGVAGVQNGNSYEFTNLNPSQEVSIEVTAIGNSDCGNTSTIAICTANDCPTISLGITPIAAICVDDMTNEIPLEVVVGGSDGSGIGTWSGNGVVNGIFDPKMVAEGVHEITYTFTEVNCDFTESIFVNVNFQPQADAGQTFHLDCNLTEVNLEGSNSTTFGNITWTTDLGNIVSGDDSFTPLIDAPGTYFLNINNSGCESNAEVIITQNISTPIADAGTEKLITCNENCVVVGGNNTSQGNTFTYSWTGPNGFISNQINPEVCEEGQYILTVFDTENGCFSNPSEVTVLENTSLPIASIQSFSSLDCVTSAVVLDGSISSTGSEFTYQWYDANGAISNGNNSSYQANIEGVYYLEVTNSLTGCVSMDSFLLLDLTTFPVVEIFEPEVLTCVLTEINLDATNSTASSSIIYSWTGPPTGIVSGADSNVAIITLPGTYQLNILDAENGCTATSSVLVTQNIIPPVADAGANIEFECNEFEATLGGGNSSIGNNFIYQWTSTNPNSTISNPTISNPIISGLGNYTLTILDTENGCVAIDEVIVSQSQNIPEVLNYDSEGSVCHGDDNGLISIQSVDGGNAPYLFSINQSPFSSQLIYNNLPPGEYEIIAQDAFGCELTTSVLLTEPDLLSIDLGEDIYLELGDSAMVEATTTGVFDTAIWQSNYDYMNCDLAPFCWNPVFAPLNTTNVSALILDENGCMAEDQLTIFVDKKRFVYIPNAFAPNGHEDNQVFMIYGGKDVRKINNFRIFSRWGETLYEAYNFAPNDRDVGWDGTFNGKKLNPGVFVYFAEIEFIDGKTIIYKGDVTLTQ